MQYHKSDIILENNGKLSRSKNINHIKNSYFFVMDILSHSELLIKHCSTERMWADILTKSFQYISLR